MTHRSPLTPPCVRFSYTAVHRTNLPSFRWFSFWIVAVFAVEVVFQKWNISTLSQAGFGDGRPHNWATRDCPTAHTGVGKSARPTFLHPQLTKRSKPTFRSFPLFPDTVPQAAAYPRIQVFEFLITCGVLEVIDPTHHQAVQLLNALGKGNGTGFARDDFDFLF